jgi:hypothetical protein
MMRSGHLPVWPLLVVIILMAGCGGAGQKSPPDEVRAFFAAANEANYLGVMSMSPNQVDLSGYTQLMGVQYPPTQKVDVLSSPPSRWYQAFAVLESSVPDTAETYDAGLLEALKNKARAIGADAIILCHPADRLTLMPGLQKASTVAAVAIKYRLEDREDQNKRP